MALTRFILTLRRSREFRTKGGFLDRVELSLSLRFSCKRESRGSQAFEVCVLDHRPPPKKKVQWEQEEITSPNQIQTLSFLALLIPLR